MHHRASVAVGMFLAFFCSFPCACQGSDTENSDVHEQNGTRFKRMWLVGAGGSRMLAPGIFWDAATQKTCSLNSTREVCIGEEEPVEDARYIDRECTKVGIATSARVARLARTCTSTYFETSPSAEVFDVPYRYAKVGGHCEVVEGQTYVRLPTGERPTFTFRLGEGSGRLRPIIAESSDGLRVLGGAPIAFDTLTGEQCTLAGGACRYSGQRTPQRSGDGLPVSVDDWEDASTCPPSPFHHPPADSRVIVMAPRGEPCEAQTIYAPTIPIPFPHTQTTDPSPRRIELRGPYPSATVRISTETTDRRTTWFVADDDTRLAHAGIWGNECSLMPDPRTIKAEAGQLAYCLPSSSSDGGCSRDFSSQAPALLMRLLVVEE